MNIEGPYHADTNRLHSTGRYEVFGVCDDGYMLHWVGSGESWDFYEPNPPTRHLHVMIDGRRYYCRSSHTCISDALEFLRQHSSSNTHDFTPFL